MGRYSKKDYELTARILSTACELAKGDEAICILYTVIAAYATAYQDDNMGSFDFERFIMACKSK